MLRQTSTLKVSRRSLRASQATILFFRGGALAFQTLDVDMLKGEVGGNMVV